ncbi:DUF6702 family protein [Flavobacterium sp.]|uniref:DUF6702 family protein n=1 Tax=Flavobacterium sp. TaxID=239 RepID=UPI00352700F1
MKKIKLIIVFCLLVTLSSFVVWHKFYVSVTQVNYNENKNRVEISSRIFIDDLEKALDEKYDKKLNLATKIEDKKAKTYIENYLTNKIKVAINGKEKAVLFLGIEYEDDVVICYLKTDFSKKITTFEFTNSILTELYSEQQNITHITIGNKKESFLFTKSNPKQLIKTN